MLRLFLGKLKSKWSGPFLISKVLQHRVIELENKEGARFMVNGQRIKIYLGHAGSAHEVVEAYHLDEVSVIKDPTSCSDIKSCAYLEAIQGISSRKR